MSHYPTSDLLRVNFYFNLIKIYEFIIVVDFFFSKIISNYNIFYEKCAVEIFVLCIFFLLL